MSYQYPPPPSQNGADMDMPPSGYLPNYSVPPQSSAGMDMRSGPDAGIPPRDRSDSFSKSLKLKRSISTPAVGAPQPQPPAQQLPLTPQQSSATQDSLALAAEKRRNKLGYHRTSVACDQQPPQDTRQKSASRSSVGPKIASTSSSPALQTGLPSEMHGSQPYPQLSMPSIQNMPPPTRPAGTENYTPDSKSQPAKAPPVPSSATSSRPYDYGHHSGMTNWMSADASPSSSKPSDLNNTWRSYPAESPVTPAFSPYTPHAPPPSATWSASVGPESSSRDEMGWSTYPAPPSRSMSFGAAETPQQYPSISQMSNHSSRPYDRKSGSISSDMYPPPIATTIPGIETVPGTTLEHNVSLSAGAVPSSSYGSWQQSYSYSKPTDNYPGWYGESGAQQHIGSGEQHPPEHSYYER
ncbi:hypothetical protein OQA88_3831 [Cercophora sp. LCS_1]